MRNRSALIGIGILVVGLVAAIMIFTTINNTPSGGSGRTDSDNVSASAREAVPDAVGGEAPDQPQPTP